MKSIVYPSKNFYMILLIYLHDLDKILAIDSWLGLESEFGTKIIGSLA